MAARGAVGAHVGRMQRIDADHAGAQARGELDQRAQVGEIADAPVALGAHAVELNHEPPDAAEAQERLGLKARAFLERDLLRRQRRTERRLQRAPGLGVELVLALPDVEVARRDLAQAIHQVAVQGSSRRPLPFPRSGARAAPHRLHRGLGEVRSQPQLSAAAVPGDFEGALAVACGSGPRRSCAARSRFA